MFTTLSQIASAQLNLIRFAEPKIWAQWWPLPSEVYRQLTSLSPHVTSSLAKPLRGLPGWWNANKTLPMVP